MSCALAPQPRDLDITEPWLVDVYALCSQQNTDAAMDALFTGIDGLLTQQDYERCDALLQSIDLQRLSASLLVGVLAITLAAAQHLRQRQDVARRIANRLKELEPIRAERLLDGLQ